MKESPCMMNVGAQKFVESPAWCLTAASLQFCPDSNKTFKIRYLPLISPVLFSSSPPWRTVTNNKNPLNQNITFKRVNNIRAPLSGCLRRDFLSEKLQPISRQGQILARKISGNPPCGGNSLSFCFSKRIDGLSCLQADLGPRINPVVDRPFGGIGLEIAATP